MAWTAPATYTTGEIVTAAKLNAQVYNNLRYLKGLDGEVLIENNLNVGTGAGVTLVRINGSASNARVLAFRSDGSDRWNFGVSATTENFAIGRYNSSGVFQNQPLLIEFATGRLTVQSGFRTTQGPGGFATFGASAVSTTPVTMVSTGVSRRAAGHITAWHSGGTGGGASFSVGAGTTTIYNDGTNTVTVTLTGGAITVQRGSGSGTFDVSLAFCYQ